MSRAAHQKHFITRRDFLTTAATGMAALLVACQAKPAATQALLPATTASPPAKPIVSIVKSKTTTCRRGRRSYLLAGWHRGVDRGQRAYHAQAQPGLQ